MAYAGRFRYGMKIISRRPRGVEGKGSRGEGRWVGRLLTKKREAKQKNCFLSGKPCYAGIKSIDTTLKCEGVFL